MTTLVLENLAALPFYAHSLRLLLARYTQAGEAPRRSMLYFFGGKMVPGADCPDTAESTRYRLVGHPIVSQDH
jgi:hypothetical protein